MTTSPQAQRPKVRGTVILTAFLAILQIAVGAIDLSSPDAASGAAINILFGIFLLVIAFLISRYKRIGLILGLIVYAYLLLSYIIVISSGGSFDLISIGTLIIILAAAYYLYIYLTHTPEKQFFT